MRQLLFHRNRSSVYTTNGTVWAMLDPLVRSEELREEGEIASENQFQVETYIFFTDFVVNGV